MKIGIITYWTSTDNYGQLLQCFALQKHLRDHGHEAVVIRHYPTPHSKNLSKFTPWHIFNYVRYKIRQRRNLRTDITHDFSNFRNHINWSDKAYVGFNALKAELWDDYDAFICGSDQIWSPKCDDELKTYFLKFAPFQKNKIAYAPSFGAAELSNSYQAQLSSLLSQFNAISVRESSAIDIIAKAGKQSQLVADPTLLLSKETYLKELNISHKKEDSAFCYFIKWETDASDNDILEFCRQRNVKPLLFSTQGYQSQIPFSPQQTPENWLNTLASSRYSIINSFHGLVFSLIFHVPFAVYLLQGAQAAMNSRIYSLLDLVGLRNRIVGNDNRLDQIFNSEIDWSYVDSQLGLIIKTSKSYLEDALNPKHSDNNSKHNICFLTSGSIHHRYGGLDRVTETLADRFEADGHTVKFLSLRNRGEFNKLRQSFLPDAIKIDSESNIEFLSDFLTQNKIDILINQEPSVNLCIPLRSRNRLKTISCLHFSPNYIDDNHFARKFPKSTSPAKWCLHHLFALPPVNKAALTHLRKKLGRNYRHNLQWCDHLVLLSHRFADSFIKITGRKADMSKLEAIHNPLPAHAFNDSGLTEKENIILYVGRLDNNFKRIDEIIRDIADIVNTHPDWKLVICGDGPDKDYLQQIARQCSDNIHFTGYVDPMPWYARAKILVLRSSKSEGWGMVITEAMANGVVPVAAGTYASLPDIISDKVDGRIVDDDSCAFKSAVEQLVETPQSLSGMSEKARERSHAFCIDRIAPQWYKLFDL